MKYYKKIILSFFIIISSFIGYLIFKKQEQMPLAIMKMYISNNHHYAIRSLRDFFLIIDTGQQRDLILEEHILNFVDSKRTDQTTTLTTFKERFTNLPIYQIKNLKFENYKISNISCIKEVSDTFVPNISVRCHCNSHEHVKTSGGIGMGILSRYNFKLDYQRREFTLFKKGYLDPNIINKDYVKIPYSSTNYCKLPIIELDTNYGPKKFLVDTGSTCSVINKKNQQKYNTVIHNNLAIAQIELAYQKNPLMKTDFLFIDMVNDVADDVDGILGYTFLVNYIIFFDTKAESIYFRPI